MSTERTVRVAMIGAGNMANRVHYPSLASFDDVEFAGICDLDETKLNATADTYGIEHRFTDFRKMAEQVAPDAIYSVGPPHLMYDTWVWCLQQGLNLFVEKPLGLTQHQAHNLADLAERHGCITQVDFQRRTTPLTVYLTEAVRARGPVQHAVVRFYKNQISPFTGAIDHMLDDGTHAIDTLRWLCGGEVTEITSTVRRVGVPDINAITATLSFSTGATGVLLANWASGRRIFGIEIHGHGIVAELEPEVAGTLWADGNLTGQTLDSAEISGSDEFFIKGGFQAKNREFIDAVQAGTQPGSHFGDAVKTMDVAARILAQATLTGA